MECGSQEVLCHVLTWVSENELAARKLNDLVIRLSEGTNGGIAIVGAFLASHGQLLIGLFGASFGFWRYWRYRERILHKRLEEFIGTRDSRLREIRSEVLGAIQRPAPGQSFNAPLFIDKQLRSVLRENRWGNGALALSIESNADWQLSKAIDSITRKLKTAEREVGSLRQELSTAYSLRGAVAALRSGDKRDRAALDYFRDALGLPGHSNDIRIKELEAHQLRKMGELKEARRTYSKVIRLSRMMESKRTRFVIEARARRYLAELEPSPKNAYAMMIAPSAGKRHSPGPFALVEECTPLDAWELLEKGDMHYFTAYLAKELTYPNAMGIQLRHAKDAYRASWSKLDQDMGSSKSRLYQLIVTGLQRVARAETEKVYDADWLPKLQKPQQPAAKISATGSKQAIPETAQDSGAQSICQVKFLATTIE